MDNLSFTEKFNLWIKTSITLKLFILGFLILIMLIPINMILSLINERNYRKNEAIFEVSSKWGAEQVIAGPIITIPYKLHYKNEKGDIFYNIKYHHFLPESLTIEGTIKPETRYRGIYAIILYNSNLKIAGKFLKPKLEKIDTDLNNVLIDKAFISLGITDLAGIKENIELNWNNEKILFNPGVETNEVLLTGISTNISLNADTYDFNFNLNLNGSKTINFVPVAKDNNVNIISEWRDPSFMGMFLPDKREISENGFNANWNILHLNRNFPQDWAGNTFNIITSNFGVQLFPGVDQYLKTTRTTKYAVLFISLTFLIFFFVEVLNKKLIHPIQYLLVGLALCIFYVLLLSLSEHLNFNYAYLISSISIIMQITFYSKSIFKNYKLTIIMFFVLTLLYTFLFFILQMEDYSLLFGSIGLFFVMVIIMYLSKNINWYNENKIKE